MVVYIILHGPGTSCDQFMVFQDGCHDCADSMPSLQMTTSDKHASVSFAFFVPCGDMTGDLLIVCQQCISVFVIILKQIRVRRTFRKHMTDARYIDMALG